MWQSGCPERVPLSSLSAPKPESGRPGSWSLRSGRVRWPLAGLGALVLALIWTLSAAAQVPVSRFGRLTVEDGLPHSATFSIRQGPNGFLWFGTQSGLCRWDGYGCRIFRHDPSDPTSLPSDFVTGMVVDGKGELWLATQNGLARFDGPNEGFERWSHDPSDPGSLPDDMVHVVFVDGRGTLWVGTHRGLARFDPSTGRFERMDGGGDSAEQGIGQQTIYAIDQDEEGALWVGTVRGLFRCRPEPWQCVAFRHAPGDPTSIGHDLILAITEDTAGNLWVGTGGGLDRFLDESGTFERFSLPGVGSDNLRIFELLADQRGDLWVGIANHGVARIPADGGEPEGFLHNPGEPESVIGNRVISMAEDHQGSLWFGTYVGVSNWIPTHQQFATFRQRPGEPSTLSGNNISALLESDAETLWVGTWDRGLNRLDRGSAQVTQFRADPSNLHSLPDETVTSLLIDGEGDLWVGTWGGLARHDPGRGGFERIPMRNGGPPIGAVTAMHEDSTGQLWVGHFAAVTRFDERSRQLVPFAVEEGLGEGWITAIVESADGSLWLAGNFEGLLRLAPGGEQLETYHPDSRDTRCGEKGLDLLSQAPDRLWVVTDRGLERYDLSAGRSTCYPVEQLGGQVVSIAEAPDGSLWMGSDRGLKRLDPANGAVEGYGVEDGLQASVFSARSAFASPRGELFFGGIRGFNAFYPERLHRETDPPPIVISSLRIHDRPVAPRWQDPGSPLESSILETTELVLDHRQSTVTFELAALDFAAPRSSRYAYRMEGLEDHWVQTDAERRFARYVQLPPGHYTFRARAGSRHGAWGEERALHLVVEPAPWRSPWAYAAYTLLVVLLVTAYVRLQRLKLAKERAIARREREVSQRLRELDRFKDRLLGERQRLVDDLRLRNEELAEISVSAAHDLSNPLTTIRAFVGSMRRDLDQGRSDRFGQDLGRIDGAARSMRRMLAGLHEIARIASSTPVRESVDLAALIRYQVREQACDASEAELSIDPDIPRVIGDPALLEALVGHLVRNAFEHASPSRPLRLAVGGERRGGRVVFELRDNGKGIDPRYRERVFKLFESLEPAGHGGRGLGLSLARRIVELHGGQIRLESAGIDQGTIVVFDLPLTSSTETSSRATDLSDSAR